MLIRILFNYLDVDSNPFSSSIDDQSSCQCVQYLPLDRRRFSKGKENVRLIRGRKHRITWKENRLRLENSTRCQKRKEKLLRSEEIARRTFLSSVLFSFPWSLSSNGNTYSSRISRRSSDMSSIEISLVFLVNVTRLRWIDLSLNLRISFVDSNAKKNGWTSEAHFQTEWQNEEEEEEESDGCYSSRTMQIVDR